MGTISTRNIDYSANFVKGNETTQSSTVAFFLCIPVMMQDLNMVEIVDMAMKKEGYDFMTNVTISTSSVTAIVYNSVTYKVQGTGWKKTGVETSENVDKIDTFAYSVRKNKDEYELIKIETN
jgi:hypothetical protein